MEYRSLRLAAGLILIAIALQVSASGPTEEQQSAWNSRMEAAKADQEHGKRARNEAKQRYEAEKEACFKRFRVTECQEDARRTYVGATNEARRIENQGLTAEHQVRRERLTDRDTRAAAEAAEREAELRQREADVAAERAARDGKRAQKISAKERQAAAGERKHARDVRRQAEKRVQHNEAVARKVEKAEKTAKPPKRSEPPQEP